MRKAFHRQTSELVSKEPSTGSTGPKINLAVQGVAAGSCEIPWEERALEQEALAVSES